LMQQAAEGDVEDEIVDDIKDDIKALHPAN
jgi:hypothetical protein